MPDHRSWMRRSLLVAMVLVACGGLSFHLKLHSPFDLPGGSPPFVNAIPALLGILDVVFVTILFSRRQTAVYGYLLNGMLVVYGTVMMTHFGWTHLPNGAPWWRLLAHPIAADLPIAWADFFMGAVMFRLWQEGG